MNKRVYPLLLLIIIVGLFFRLYHLDLHDVVTDEAFYGMRSIGLIDFLGTSLQPTPFEWFEEVPWWARVSFHDHPPLTFWIENIFFTLFGATVWVMRLPFALAGVASIFLMFLIARDLTKDYHAALVSSALLSVSAYHIWISRIGLQESLLIFFMLLSVWLFVRFCSTGRHLYLIAVALGFAVLVKYTVVVLIPIFGLFLLFAKPQKILLKKVIIASFLFIVIISPIIIYNVFLYKARGHFDFQLSYLLGQDVPNWESRPGREVGGMPEKFSNFFTNYLHFHGILFSAMSVLAIFHLFLRRKERASQFIIISLFFFFALFMAIGPQERFLVMATPLMALAIAFFYMRFAEYRFAKMLLIIFLLTEAFFSVNTHFIITPYGKESLYYSSIRKESPFLGLNELEKFLLKETEGLYPRETFPIKYAFVRELQNNAREKAEEEGKNPIMKLFVTDSRMNLPSYLWYFERYIVYEGWPMISDENYLYLVKNDKNYFTEQGFTETIFMKINDSFSTIQNNSASSAAILEDSLITQGKEPELLYSLSGKEALRIYRFESLQK